MFERKPKPTSTRSPLDENAGEDFRTEMFAFRCPIMPVDDDGQRNLIRASAIFRSAIEATSAMGSPAFE